MAKKYHSLKSDYDAWLDEIYKNPLVGDDFGDGVRKIRMIIADKGLKTCKTLSFKLYHAFALCERFEKVMQDFNQNRRGRNLRPWLIFTKL